MKLLGLLPFVAFVTSCSQPAPPPSPTYTLACESLDAPAQSTLQCVRTDTRNGDVRLIDLDRVPFTSGPSRAMDEAAGTYQTVCDATTTSQGSDLWCVRLHVFNGEVVILKLSELPRWPNNP